MNTVSNKELDRQYRSLKQMISMHSMLRDQYHRRAVFINLVLLAASVVFCATTFACDYISKRLGVSEELTTDVLGVASITAFFAALAALVLDWKGKAARHSEAVKALTNALVFFRNARTEDDWPEAQVSALSQAYWNAASNVVPIPDGRFTALKARHLRKVEVSRTSDSMPGCPLFLIRFRVFFRSVFKLMCKRSRMGDQ